MPSKKKGKSTGRKVGKSKSSGGSSKGMLQLTGTAAVTGGVTSMLDVKLLSKVSNTAKGLVMVVGGGGLAWKAKPMWMKGIGVGVAVWGAIRAIQGITGATISGIGRAPNLNGFPTPPAIGTTGAPRSSLNNFPTPPAIGAGNTRTRHRTNAAYYAGAGM